MVITDHILGASHIWMALAGLEQDTSHCTYQGQIQRFANLSLKLFVATNLYLSNP